MADPFLGEIKIISWNYAPRGWSFCNGQLMAISQNQALFAILGTQFGGDGVTTFGLPDFRGRAPVHQGPGFVGGQGGGEEFHTLLQSEMPGHLHQLTASSQPADQATLVTPPANTPNILAAVTVAAQYAGASSLTPLTPDTVTSAGSSQPHENRMPFLVLNFIIALQGIFPSRN